MEYETRIRDVTGKVTEVTRQRDGFEREVNELRLQLRLSEESREQLRAEHAPCAARIHELLDVSDVLKRELNEVKRALGEEQREGAAARKQLEDVKVKLRAVEAERIELGRALQDTRQQLASARLPLAK